MKWLLVVMVALTYHILGKLSFMTALPISPAGPALAWLPTGFAVAALFIFGYGVWPGIMLGSLLNANFEFLSPVTVAGFILANTLDPLIAVWLTRRLVGREVDFCRPWDVARFLGVVIFVSAPVSASLGALAIFVAQATPPLSFAMTWATWWISDAVSVLVLTPMMLAWRKNANEIESDNRIGEKMLVAWLGLGVLYLIFSMPLGRDTIHFVYWVFPFIIWQAFRHGLRVTVSGVFVLALVTIAATAQGFGPFQGQSVALSFLYVQSFLATSSITALLVVALVSERDRAIHDRDEFIIIASHELSTPLTVLTMLSKFLHRLVAKEELDSMSRKQRVDLVGMNARETQRLSRLVEDLLEGSRISTGKLVLESKLTDLSMIVRDVMQDLAQQVDQSTSIVHVDASAPVEGHWDERRLSFVVRTLIANALKFGEGKPVSISVSTSGQWAVLEVTDRGIGIAHENQERVFERFTRLSSVSSLGGLGQGLYISSAIAHAHGGRIRVESELGRGAKFILELPFKS